VYARLTSTTDDIRNSYTYSESWNVTVLSVHEGLGLYHKAHKQYPKAVRDYFISNSAPKAIQEAQASVMSSASAAVQDAVETAEPQGYHSVGRAVFTQSHVTLAASKMLDGDWTDDMVLERREMAGEEHLVARKGTHYNDDSWTDVYLFVGYTCNEAASSIGGGERMSLTLRMEEGLLDITVDADEDVHEQIRGEIKCRATLEVHMGGAEIEDGTTFSENGVSEGAILDVTYTILGEAAEQEWVRWEGVSPYCDAVYVAASVESLFEYLVPHKDH